MTDTDSPSLLRPCFFTSISSNYLAKALTLAESVVAIYPDAEFVIAILNHSLLTPAHLDELAKIQARFSEQGHQLSFVDPLSLYEPGQARCFAYRYNVIEACTAVKPAVALELLKRHECVTYMDPDTFLYAPFPADARMGEAWDLQVTPHSLAPPSQPGLLSERYFMSYGIYNLGYLGMRRSATTLAFLAWWKRFCIDFSVSKSHLGLFVDQKPIDLLTCFVDRVSVIRHPGWNVGWWNLFCDQREISADGCSVRFESQQEPLIFFHFSNLDSPSHGAERAVAGPLKSMLKNSPIDIRLASHPGIAQLFKGYEQAMQPWKGTTLLQAASFNTTLAGQPISGRERALLGEAMRLGLVLRADPFSFSPRALAYRCLRHIISQLHRQDLKQAWRYMMLGAKSALTPTLLRRDS